MRIHRAAATALGQIGGSAEAISALTEAFQTEPDPYYRRDYLAALGNIGSDAAISLPVLLETLRAEESDYYNILAYAEAFSKIYHNNPSGLIALLEDDSPLVRQAAAIALSRVGADALPELIAALDHEQADVRVEIANSIAQIGQDATSAVPTLVERLSDPSPIVRTQAAYALGAIGSTAKVAIPVLEKQLEDEDWSVRIAAAYALWQIDEQKIGLPTLADALDVDVDEEIRSVAAYLLGQIGEPEVVPPLIEALRYTDSSYGVTLLVLIGLSDDETVPGLIAALQDEDPAIRSGAANTLGWGGSSLAVPALLEYLKQERAALRQLLPGLIAQLEAGQPISTDVLERYPRLRWWAEPNEALTFLRELKHDQDQLNDFIFGSAGFSGDDIQRIIYGIGGGSPMDFMDSLQRVVARVRGQ